MRRTRHQDVDSGVFQPATEKPDALSTPRTVPAAAVAAYVGVRALFYLLARPARVHVNSMSGLLMAKTTDAAERRRYTEWQSLVQMLTRADHLLTTGAVSPSEHEAIWWRAYNRLGELAFV